MLTGRAKSIRITGDSVNQRPGKWSSTVQEIPQLRMSTTGAESYHHNHASALNKDEPPTVPA